MATVGVKTIVDDLDQMVKHLDTYMHSSAQHNYERGFSKGIQVAANLTNTNISIDKIDIDSIKIFVDWCYIHGIDFSYMRRSDDDISFPDKIISEFKEYIDSEKYECKNQTPLCEFGPDCINTCVMYDPVDKEE